LLVKQGLVALATTMMARRATALRRNFMMVMMMFGCDDCLLLFNDMMWHVDIPRSNLRFPGRHNDCQNIWKNTAKSWSILCVRKNLKMYCILRGLFLTSEEIHRTSCTCSHEVRGFKSGTPIKGRSYILGPILALKNTHTKTRVSLFFGYGDSRHNFFAFFGKLEHFSNISLFFFDKPRGAAQGSGTAITGHVCSPKIGLFCVSGRCLREK
jgi:hypothetical protein